MFELTSFPLHGLDSPAYVLSFAWIGDTDNSAIAFFFCFCFLEHCLCLIALRGGGAMQDSSFLNLCT